MLYSNLKFLALAFFCVSAQMAFGQVTLSLAEGKTFTIDATKTYKDKYNNTYYLRETADTIYNFKYSETAKSVEEMRIPLQCFNKANSKENESSFTLKSGKAYTDIFVAFKCSKGGKDMLKGFKNYFIALTHNASGTTTKTECLELVKFGTEDEAKAFLKRVQARVKALN